MDSDLQQLVDATGMTMPLAGRIVSVVLASGASQMEIRTALEIVDKVICLLPVPILADGVGAPELHPRQS